MVFSKTLFTLYLCPLAYAQNESEFSLDMRTFSSLLPLVHQHPAMFERGSTSPGKALGSQFTWDLYQAKCPQVMALNSLSCHIPCVQPGAIPGILDGSFRATIYQPFLLLLLRGGNCGLYIKLAQERSQSEALFCDPWL